MKNIITVFVLIFLTVSCKHTSTTPATNLSIHTSPLYDIEWKVKGSYVCLYIDDYRKLANNMEIIQNYIDIQNITNGN